jgi:hypothetical protein
MHNFKTVLAASAALMLTAPMVTDQASAKCLGHVHYLDDGVRKAETFEITEMRVSKDDGVKYGGHGTDWYSPSDIRITGKCQFVPSWILSGDQYFDQTKK